MRKDLIIIFILLFVLFFGNIFYISHNFLFAAKNAIVDVTAKISVCGNNIKESGEHCDGTNFGGKSCLDLGFTNGGNLSCSASCEFNTSNCATNAETTAIPLFSSSIGGEYTISNVNNSALVSLPQNFYSQDLRLQMFSCDKSVTEPLKPPPSGKEFIGKTYDFVFINPDGGTVSALSQPAVLTLTYTDTDVSGMDENTLAPYRQGSSDTSWQIITGSTLDTINNKVTFSTPTFSSFALFGSPAQQQDSGGSGSSGGGGGGGASSQQTIITFSGKAFLNGMVTLLKDAQIATTAKVYSDGNFQVSLFGISAGNYIFSIYSEDNNGNRSSVLSFPISIVSGTTTSKSDIVINTPIFLESEIIKGDLNSDKRVNLIDFSIAAYWYKRANPPASVDFNGDGRINLVDFSILAYYWTG